jgi:hypothetical protein
MHLRIFHEEFSVGPDSAVLKVCVAVEGVAALGVTKLTPYFRTVNLNGMAREVPEEFRKGGAQSLASIGPTDEDASNNLCRAYLDVNGW